MNVLKTSTVVLCLVMVTACAQTPREYRVNPHRMSTPQLPNAAEQAPESALLDEQEGVRVSRLEPLASEEQEFVQAADIASRFSDSDSQQVTANQLSMREFTETVFGQVLGVNYVLSPEAEGSEQNVTLNVAEAVSSRRLYSLTEQLLDDRGLQVRARDNVLYITERSSSEQAGAIIGIGRSRGNVPEAVGSILQIIPLQYGATSSLERTLNRLTSARITADYTQSALFVEGGRAEIIRVIDIVSLLDRPAHRGKHVGLLELTYLTPQEFVPQVTALLEAEGIRAATSTTQGAGLLLVPVEQIGAVALFAGEDFALSRAEFWASQIDKPTRGSEKRYYIYNPRHARASDLGRSIAPLIGNFTETGSGDNTRDTQSAVGQRQLAQGSQPRSGQQTTSQTQISVSSEDLNMTVDERSNSIIFYTSGETYQSLLPIVRRLDIMPKQILLDATIAEVTMTDEFSQGFEFAFRNGKINGGTLGNLGVGGMGGLAVNWQDGFDQIIARLSASTNLVNVLSNPTLVVRDGVQASISVGNDIPTIGATTSDPIQSDRQTTIVNYRKTGVQLSVRPTINAQGLVVLEIDQQISNTADGGPSIGGSPSIFERTIQTEVIAQSGQTILLGGLISENSSDNVSEVPGFARIPLLGHLFRGRSESTEKTELVIFITPRVIDSVDQWTEIRSSIAQGLTNLSVEE